MESKRQQRYNNLSFQLPDIYEFKNAKNEIKLEFTDRTHQDYKVIKEDLIYIGKTKSYKDHIAQGLNPILGESKAIYGVAKKHEPKTKSILSMREAVDNATSKLHDLERQHYEALKAQQETINSTTEGVKEND